MIPPSHSHQSTMEAEVRPDEPQFSASQPQSSSSSLHTTSFVPVDVVFHGLSTYPFETDPEFQAGLASILGNPAPTEGESEPAGREGLVLQAQCFYFSRRYNLPPIDQAAYKLWLQEHPSNSDLKENSAASQPPSDKPVPPSSATEAVLPSSQPPPPGIAAPYSPPEAAASSAPTSAPSSTQPTEPHTPPPFAHIVDLITRNQPIPGIEHVPDTVLEAGSSPPNKTPRRRKPWEKESQADDQEHEAQTNSDELKASQPTRMPAGSTTPRSSFPAVLQPITASPPPPAWPSAREASTTTSTDDERRSRLEAPVFEDAMGE